MDLEKGTGLIQTARCTKGTGKRVLCMVEESLYSVKARYIWVNSGNGFPNGRGIRKWKNGDLYEGDYVNGF
jgi:hypothetical protein